MSLEAAHNDIIILDENMKPPIESGEEIAILDHNNDWIYVYNPDRFGSTFMEMFDLDFVDLEPKPNENSSEIIERIKRGSEFPTTIIVGNNKSLTYIEEGLLPEYVDLKTDDYVVKISAWPIKRKTHVVYTNSKREEEIDLLKLFSNYSGIVTPEEALKRISKHFSSEWKKMHGNKNIDYLV
jgi:hypothetical protein